MAEKEVKTFGEFVGIDFEEYFLLVRNRVYHATQRGISGIDTMFDWDANIHPFESADKRMQEFVSAFNAIELNKSSN